MEGQILTHFSKLLTLLHTTCQATSTTCKTLHKSCFDHHNVLKTWVLTADEEEEAYECTCQPLSTYFDEPVELVKDIASAVERAKAARKVVNHFGNVHVSNSCKINDASEKSLKVKEKHMGNSSNSSCGRTNALQVRDSSSYDARATKNLPSITQSLPRKEINMKMNKSRLFQTTYQKDFLLRSSRLSSQSSKYGMKGTRNLDWSHCPSGKLDEAQTAIDVNSLLERVVTDVPMRNKSDTNTGYVQHIVKDNTCRVHGEVVHPVMPRCVALKEAIDVVGVPSELLKLLKVYHHYVNYDSKWELKKTKKSCRNSFLEKLNESNQNSWHSVSLEPVVKLLMQYFHVYIEILSNNNRELNTTLLKDLEEEFGILSRNYHKILDFDTNFSDGALCIKMEANTSRPEDIIDEWNWALAGIWNKKCLSMFSGLKNMVKISYGTNDDCKVLQKKFQEIQKLHLQIQILEILQNNVFPFISNLPDDHVGLTHLYKSCSALCNMSSLRVPILVKI